MMDEQPQRERSARRESGQGYYSNRLSSEGRQDERRSSGGRYSGEGSRSSEGRYAGEGRRASEGRQSSEGRSYSEGRRTGEGRRQSSRSSRDAARSNAAGRSSRSRYDRGASTGRSRASSRTAPAASGGVSALFGKINIRFIVLAVIIIALVVVIGFVVSTCSNSNSASSGQAASSASAVATNAAASGSAASSSGSDASGTSSATSTAAESAATGSSNAAASAASSSTQASTTSHTNAKSGDVTYPVAQAAKLAYRNVDFAVDPTRTNWNFDKTNGRKTIYLTFDDGPSANTEKALDILDKYDCKATFFVTGQNPDYYSWIKEAYRRGHTIGLHSMYHDYEEIYSSSEAYFADLDLIGKVVKEQIGYVPCFIRFPGGVSNTISASYSEGIMTNLAAAVQERGYQYYDWELSCGDGAVLTTEETIAAGCEPTDSENAIYLLHDGSAKETTIEALPSIIEYYQAQGYSFEALDRSSMVYHHGISN